MVDVALRRHRGAHALDDQLGDLEFLLPPGAPHGDSIPHVNGLGGLDRRRIKPHVTGPARSGRGGAGLEQTDRPQPHIQAHTGRFNGIRGHGPTLLGALRGGKFGASRAGLERPFRKLLTH